MSSQLDWFVSYSINNQLISKDNEEWLQYGLEERLCALTALVPFTFIAVHNDNGNCNGLPV